MIAGNEYNLRRKFRRPEKMDMPPNSTLIRNYSMVASNDADEKSGTEAILMSNNRRWAVHHPRQGKIGADCSAIFFIIFRS